MSQLEALKDLQDALLLRQAVLRPVREANFYDFAGGDSQGDEYALEVAPKEYEEILEWIGDPCFLESTLLGIEMPSDNTPDVGWAVRFDKRGVMVDWTIEEYNTLLGLGPTGSRVLAGYGGCTLYDTTNNKFAAITVWELPVSKSLELYIKNWSDEDTITVNIYDAVVHSYGDSKNIKKSAFAWKV